MSGQSKEVAKQFILTKETVFQCFPNLWTPTLACLAASAAVSFKNLAVCPSVVLSGPSGSGKSTVLRLFDSEPFTLRLDDFSPAAVVSHLATKTPGQLDQQDLVRKLAGRVMVTDDLGPLFTDERERQSKNFSVITKLMDGHGYVSASGTHGLRGWSKDTFFAWLAGTLRVSASTWELMGKLGTRLLFFQMPKTDLKTLDPFSTDYLEKHNACREVVSDLLTVITSTAPPRTLDWGNPTSAEIRDGLVTLADVMMCGRGLIADDGEIFIDDSQRVAHLLLAISVGKAFLEGRNELTTADLSVAFSLALDSMPAHRSVLLKALVKEGELVRKDGMEVTGKTRPPVADYFEELECLGLAVRVKKTDGQTSAEHLIPSTLVEQVRQLAHHIQADTQTGATEYVAESLDEASAA